MAAIFTYGFPVAAEAFNKAGVTLCTLSDYNSMLEAALETDYIKAEDIARLIAFRNNPSDESWIGNKEA